MIEILIVLGSLYWGYRITRTSKSEKFFYE